MPTFTLTDYLTLQDGVRRVDGNPNAIDLRFKLPSDFVKGTNLAKPVLKFQFTAHEKTDLEVWVNLPNSPNSPQINITLEKSPVLRVYHEFIDGRLFKPGDENEIKFLLTDNLVFGDSNNDISFSDILLMFQRKVSI